MKTFIVLLGLVLLLSTVTASTVYMESQRSGNEDIADFDTSFLETPQFEADSAIDYALSQADTIEQQLGFRPADGEESLVEVAGTTPFSQATANQFRYYAQFGYCDNLNNALTKVSWYNNMDKTTYRNFLDAKTQAFAFVAVINNPRAILVSFRGTSNFPNMIQDAKFIQVPSPFGTGKVHQGFRDCYLAIQNQVKAYINQLRSGACKGCGLWVTGHSLGGAVATLAAADYATITNNLLVYTYGSPRVGDATFANWYNGRAPSTYRITHASDLVPHVPFQWLGFVHVGHEVYFPTAATNNAKMCVGAESKQCLDGAPFKPNSAGVADHLSYFGIPMTCSPPNIIQTVALNSHHSLITVDSSADVEVQTELPKPLTDMELSQFMDRDDVSQGMEEIGAQASAEDPIDIPTDKSLILTEAAVKNPPYNFPLALTLQRFSRAAYCDPGQLSSWTHGVAQTGELSSAANVRVFQNEKTGALGYVSTANVNGRRSVVLAFRGTVKAQLTNWLTDIQILRVKPDFGPGTVHDDFHKAWAALKAAGMLDYAKSLITGVCTGCPTLITGHSLGAALATLAAPEVSLITNDINVYTYGSPRVGDNTYQSFFDTKFTGRSFRVTHQRDAIPSIPFLWLGYRHVGSEIYYPDNSLNFKFCGPDNDNSCSAGSGFHVGGGAVTDHDFYLGEQMECQK